MKTVCNDCVFFREKEKTCQLNRLSILHNEVIEIGDIIELNRFCNAKRKSKWITDYRRPIIDVMKEIYTKIDIIILNNFEENIKNFINFNHMYLVSSVENLEQYIKNNITFIKVYDGDLILETIPKLTGEYVLILDKPFKFDLDKINHLLNFKMERLSFIENPFLINKALLTFLAKSFNTFEEIKANLYNYNKYEKKWSEL